MNYLELELYETKNFPFIGEMTAFYEEAVSKHLDVEMFMYFNAIEAQKILQNIRQITGNNLIDRGTYALSKIGGGLYECRASFLSTRKLWRVLKNFAPALCEVHIDTYEVSYIKPKYIGGPEILRTYTTIKKWVR